jgi:integrase
MALAVDLVVFAGHCLLLLLSSIVRADAEQAETFARIRPHMRRVRHVVITAAACRTPLRPHRLTKTFEKALKTPGLPHFRLYDLRHPYASHLIAQPAAIALSLGNSATRR